MSSVLKLLIAILAIIIFISCSSEEFKETENLEYLSELNEWHIMRIESLKKETGWLNLVGLYWIDEGENRFGSDQTNDIIFPNGKSEKFIGKIIKRDSIITTVINENAVVLHNENIVRKIRLKSDVTGDPTILKHNSLRWFVIKRGNRYGIRLRDLEADLLSSFEGIERFPVQDKWRITASFEPYDTLKKIMIPNILGTVNEDYTPGKIHFTLNEKNYSLEPTRSGNRLFIVFADLTSGEETYGAGRFLYIDGPDSNNTLILDFNKVYNPPCAFTKYATCPLAPEENKLKIRITAGEKYYEDSY